MEALGNKKNYLIGLFLITVFIVVFLLLFAKEAKAETFRGGAIDADEVWVKADGPYVVTRATFLYPGATLTIEQGTIVKFMENAEIEAGAGSLVARGTRDEPIIFTSYYDDSVGGDTDGGGESILPTTGSWWGLEFHFSNDIIEYAEIRYAANCIFAGFTSDIFQNIVAKHCGVGILANYDFTGQILNNVIEDSVFGMRMVRSQNAIYKNNKILNSRLVGVKWDGSGAQNQDVVFQNNIVSGSPRGMEVNNVSGSVITDNNIEGNSEYGIFNLYPPVPFDAGNNWWGDASGPFHSSLNPGGLGNAVNDGVLFDPVLDVPAVEPEEPPGKRPVIIIPGILGSAEKNGELVIDPILHTYDDLIATLLANGFEDGVTLFTFPYEWRDSNTQNALRLRDRINGVQSICECDKVDLVAHSMGGLIARQYVQFGHYEDDVGKLIFLGTPHLGSQEAYLTWEAGEAQPDIFSQLRRSLFAVEALKNHFPSLYYYVRNRPVSSVQELLPIFDYIKDEKTGITRLYYDNYPRNLFLESLDSSISNLINSGVEIYNLVGNSGNETIEVIRIGDRTSGGAGLWEHGEPDGFYGLLGDHGLERGEGDDTVTTYSSSLRGTLDSEIFNSSHRGIVTDSEARVYEILSGMSTDVTFDSGFNLSPKVLLFQLFSPVDMYIEDQAGNRVGKNFETGEAFDEIENAFYTGYGTDDEYITILNPLDGEYKIVLQGTDSGGEYTVRTSYLTDQNEISNDYNAVTGVGQISHLAFDFNSHNPQDLAVESTDPVTSNDLIYHINLAYDFGWIDDDKTRDKLVKWAQSIIRFESKAGIIQPLNQVVDKKLAKMLYDELPKLLHKNEINSSAYNLLKKDLEWLINN